MYPHGHGKVRGKFVGIDSLFPPRGPGNLTLIFRLGSRQPYPLSH